MMPSPALAIAWEIRQRHRWGFIAVSAYLLVVATIKFQILGPGQRINLDDAQRFAVVVVVPLATTLTYFLAVFSFGLDGDLAARQSIYPARMFTLPVTTGALAGWPMLFGSTAIAILWLATRLFAVWPPDVDVPLIWPALLAAALLAWTQALTWMPYGLPGLRVIVAVLWLAAIDAVVMLAIHFHAREALMVTFLAPQIPLAYLVARVAVARARRGDVPDWRPVFRRLGKIADILPSRRNTFPSSTDAQAWLEWRRHGRALPAAVAILLPFELALLFAAGDTPVLVLSILTGVLFTPPVMAAFAAATLSKANPPVSDARGLTSFMATRPLSSAALIVAKLKMTIWSTLAAWLLVLVAIPLALVLTGTWSLVIERARQVTQAIGAPRAIVISLLVLAGFIASTWKQLVQSLYIGLSGREWVVRSSGFLVLILLAGIGPMAQWIHDDSTVQTALWDAFPWILAVLVCIKTAAAAWVAIRLYHSRVLSDRTLVSGAALWLVTVLALYGLLVWLLSTAHFARYFMLLVAILAVPLTRLSAAPLALAWNRHR